jgi:hypothetical protein
MSKKKLLLIFMVFAAVGMNAAAPLEYTGMGYPDGTDPYSRNLGCEATSLTQWVNDSFFYWLRPFNYQSLFPDLVTPEACRNHINSTNLERIQNAFKYYVKLEDRQSFLLKINCCFNIFPHVSVFNFLGMALYMRDIDLVKIWCGVGLPVSNVFNDLSASKPVSALDFYEVLKPHPQDDEHERVKAAKIIKYLKQSCVF